MKRNKSICLLLAVVMLLAGCGAAPAPTTVPTEPVAAADRQHLAKAALVAVFRAVRQGGSDKRFIRQRISEIEGTLHRITVDPYVIKQDAPHVFSRGVGMKSGLGIRERYCKIGAENRVTNRTVIGVYAEGDIYGNTGCVRCIRLADQREQLCGRFPAKARTENAVNNNVARGERRD